MGRILLLTTLASLAIACRRVPDEDVGARVLEYRVVMEGRPVGVMSNIFRGDRQNTFFSYQDRGRGPHVRLSVTLDAAGLPARVSVDGEDEDGNEVEETFSSDGGVAVWRSPIDRGEAPAGGFYVPASAVPETLAHLARALSRTPERRLRLHPEGEARLELLAEREVSAPGAPPVRIALHAVQGLQFGPSLAWLAEDGSFFASGGPYLAVVRQDYETALPGLFRAQGEALARRERETATRLSVRSGEPVVIRGARVVDVLAGTAHEGWSVLAEDGWILAVGPDAEVKVPARATVVEAAGRTLVPGLWDLHTHPEPLGALLHLAAGVVAIRDLGSDPREAVARRRAAETRAALGPRLFLSGLIDGPGELAAPTQVLAETPAEAAAAVDYYAAAEFDGVKLYNSISPALVPAVAARAKERGLPLSGHVPNGMSAEQAVRAGLGELHHAYFLFPSLLAEQLADHPEPQRVLLREAPWMDLHGERVGALAALLRDGRVAVDATLALCESLYVGRRGRPSPAMGAVLGRLPPLVQRRVLAAGVDEVAPEQAHRMKRYLEAILGLTGALHASGVKLVAGSDGMAGFTLHRELELLQAAGLAPAEVLRIATLGAAQHLGRDREWGTIERGKRADLLLVDGDPLADIAALRRGALLLFDGAILSPAALYEAAAVRPLDVPSPQIYNVPLPTRGLQTDAPAPGQGRSPPQLHRR